MCVCVCVCIYPPKITPTSLFTSHLFQVSNFEKTVLI